MKEGGKNLLNSVFEAIKSNPKKSIALAIPIILGIIIRKQQHRMIYFPQIPGLPKSPSKNPTPYQNPMQHGLQNYKNVQIKTEDGIILRGWHVLTNNKKPQRIILYYHQNAGNIGMRLPFIRQLVLNTNSEVLIMAYRGYSDSQGSPSQKGIKKDGIQILKYAINLANQQKIPLVVFGRSLGGAVAINSCSLPSLQQKVKGLILQNTFTSISDVALSLFGNKYSKPILKFLFFFLVSNHWQSYKLIGKIRIPKLFIKSARDQLIPIEQMNILQKSSDPNVKNEQYIIKNGTHNESYVFQHEIYFNKLNRFLSSL